MEHSLEIQEVIETIRIEQRRTQMVFGIGIIVLSLVLMVFVPAVIRSSPGYVWPHTSTSQKEEQLMTDQNMQGMEKRMQKPAAASTTAPMQKAASTTPVR